MSEVYSNSFLNSTLARWQRPSSLRAPQLDCAGCLKPAKCCAFQPFVPNFLLGGFFDSADILPEIANIYFHPVGAIALPEYRARHSAVERAGEIPELDLLCGFFDREKRACILWEFRPGECSTYFCDDQHLGLARQEIRQKSFDLEVAVAQMALVELGFSPREISRQVDILNCVSPSLVAKNYPGPELLLMYKKAWNWSKTLNRETVESWM